MALDFIRSILGTEFDLTPHASITQEAIDAFVASCGEPAPGPGAAPPTFVLSMRTKYILPRDMRDRLRAAFDAGKDIEFGATVRVGDVLTSRSTVHDVYEKTGRSGTMAFMVLRTIVTNQRDEHVAVIDQKMMFR